MNALLGFLDCQEIHDVAAEGVRQILESTHMRLMQEALAARAANPHSADKKVRLRALLTTLNQHNEEVKQKKAANKENVNASKRNANIPSGDESMGKGSGRPRRKAAAAASQNIAEQVNISNREKLRQEAPPKIKTERISDLATVDDARNNAEMPPPAVMPKRAGKKKKEAAIKVEGAGARATRSRTTTPNPSEAGSPPTSKRSDVVLIPEAIPTIALDADDDAENAAEADADANELEQMPDVDSDVEARQSTKAKVKKEAAKRKKSASPEEERKPARPKRTKRKPSTPAKDADASLYEDATSEQRSPADAEIVVQQPKVLLHRLSKEALAEAANSAEADAKNRTIVVRKAGDAPQANETVVLDRPLMLNATVTLAKAPPPPNVADLMTDDESDTDAPPPSALRQPNGKAALFNPCVNSPVKKKVEAFEKLQAAEASTRMTRTKTRQKAQKASEEEQKDAKAADGEQHEPAPSTVTSTSKPKKPGYTTPLSTNRYHPSLSGKSQLSSSAQKALSAIKLSSQQFRDLEQVRREKEEAALKKRDAYYLQQAEDKRRRREEKEQKVKAQRATRDEEKRRAAEQQQEEKEEKLRCALLEKQERLMRHREEVERRRQLAKQKHEEMKRDEGRRQAEEARLLRKAEEEEERRKAEAERRLQALRARQLQKELEAAAPPVYMREPEPLLPSPDCYDSDDENKPKKSVELPKWNSKESVHQRCKAMSYIDSKVLNTLFSVKPQTPDLQELFPNVDPRKLKRNSSAVWKHPPRFTMMPELEENF